MKVGITGSIACGKSTVSNYLIERGYKVIDADKIGHNILFDNKVKEQIKNYFGDEVFENTEIVRKKLGTIVFNNKEHLKKLNEITHPRIREIILEEFSKNKDYLIFLDAALLFEGNFTDVVDKVITVFITEENQLTRLMLRDNISEQEALKRIRSQMSIYEKRDLADYVIDNNNDREETYKQIDKILNILKG